MEKSLNDAQQASVEALNSLGLTVYEAKAYLALLQKHPSHGNEISRRSGVPGAKIYETLNNLTQKGMTTTLNTTPQMYSPLPYDEFLRRKKEQFKKTEQLLATNFRKIATPIPDIAVWQLTDHDILIERSREMIDGAKETLLLSFWEEQGCLLSQNLAAAQLRGVRIVSIQFGPGFLEYGKTYRHVQVETVAARHSGEFTIVADESVGMFMAQPPDGKWNGFWTTNQGVVRLMTNYIRHDIYSNKLIHRFEQEIKREYGDNLQDLLDIEINKGGSNIHE